MVILFLMKRQIIITILLLNFSVLFSQQSKIDSLIHVTKTTTNDSIRARTYLKIYYEYHRKDFNLALDYVLKAETLALEKGLSGVLGSSKYRKGSLYKSMKKFQEAEKAYNEGISIFSELNDSTNLANIKIVFGRLLQLQARSDEAISIYIEALPIFKSTGNKNSEAKTHNYLGMLYKALGQDEKAIEHLEQALLLVRDLNFKPGISACLSNLGAIYIKLDKFDKAESLFKEALVLKNEANDKLGASIVLVNLGTLFSDKLDFTLSKSYYQKAYEIAKSIDGNTLMPRIEYGLAKNAFHLKDYKNALLYGHNVINSEAVLYDIEFRNETANLLSQSYNGLRDYENAFKYSNIHQTLSDSLYNQKIVSVTNDLEAKYKNKENAQENTLLTTQNSLQALQIEKDKGQKNRILLLTILMFIVAGMLYYLYLTKQKSNQRLKELNTIKTNFFANISHEFRTPLTLIKGPIEQLIEKPTEKLSSENVEMIQRNTNRLLKLVNQLLDLSKIDQGKLALNTTEGDIYKSLRVATSAFSSHAVQRNIDYRIQIPSSILWASFDSDKFENIIYNILGNAFKFSDDKSQLNFKVAHENETLIIEISDTGKGIKKDKLPFIFDRFYQGHTNGTQGEQGTGIGLSLAKELVELMQGTISVSSTVNVGSTFVVKIPMHKIKTPLAYNPSESLEPAKVSVGAIVTSSKVDKRAVPTVLLVEDNQDMRQYIKEHLIRDYKIKIAKNGLQGLQLALNQPPDLIITDVMMPKMDGIEFCKKLKTNIHTSHIPIIMLTAKAGIDNKIIGLETGADDYLTKPFNVEELFVRAKNLIEQRLNLRTYYRLKKFEINPKAIAVTSIDEKFLEKTLNLLENQFHDSTFGVPQMQKALGMSKTQLYRKLKALTNESPGELLRNFRLKRAAHLISEKADSIAQIAYHVGFNSVPYFTKCFKSMFEVTPTSYQNANT